jgi:hypothetical protein
MKCTIPGVDHLLAGHNLSECETRESAVETHIAMHNLLMSGYEVSTDFSNPDLS